MKKVKFSEILLCLKASQGFVEFIQIGGHSKEMGSEIHGTIFPFLPSLTRHTKNKYVPTYLY